MEGRKGVERKRKMEEPSEYKMGDENGMNSLKQKKGEKEGRKECIKKRWREGKKRKDGRKGGEGVMDGRKERRKDGRTGEREREKKLNKISAKRETCGVRSAEVFQAPFLPSCSLRRSNIYSLKPS